MPESAFLYQKLLNLYYLRGELMNRKFALGILSILAVITSVVFINTAAAAKVGKDEAAAQLISTTLVISQAYGGGGGTTGTYMIDYVELKNISGSPQSTAGL